MPLTLNGIVVPNLCQGSEWAIADDALLAEYVARIAVGQCRHVARIPASQDASAASVDQAAKADAITLLTVNAGEEPWHRDGWLFQAISWIAAYSAEGVAIRAPHLIKAHKGFDGLKLELNDVGAVTPVTIFEDKATDNPRKTIREDVWPGIERLEQGGRTNELTQEISSLLEAQLKTLPGLDVDAAVRQIVWNNVRRYRVAITVDSTHMTEAKRKRLFKGYSEQAPGDITRRGAETLLVPELRPWMHEFAQKVIAVIREMPERV